MSKPVSQSRALAAACAALLVAASSASADVHWTGANNPGAWSTAANWNTLINGSGSAQAPTSADIAIFTANGVAAAPVVNLNGAQAAAGLATNVNNAFLTTLQGGGTNSTLSLGASGINHLFGGITVGSVTDGQKVPISLQGAQSWTSSGAAPAAQAIFVLNDVSIGAGGNQTLTLTGTNTGSKIDGILSDGAGVLSLSKSGSGTWTLTNINSHSGTTTVAGGTLQVANNSALGATTGTTSVTSGQLKLSNGITVTGETIALSGGGDNFGALQSSSGSSTWAGPVTLGGSVRVGGSAGTTLTISGAITGANQISISGNSGTNTVVISAPAGSNAYTGTTNLIRGNLRLGADNTLPITTTVDVANTTAADQSTFNLAGFNQTIGALQHSGNATGGNATVTNSIAGPVKTLTVNQSGNTTYGNSANTTGVITGNLALTKSGAGTLTLTGANTYTGTTTVSGGTLLVNLTHAAAGNYVVGANATLGGTGGTITLAAGMSANATGTSGNLARIAPGSSIGTLTVNGGNGVVFGDFGNLAIELSGTTADQLIVGANLDLTSAADSITFSGTADGVTNYVIATYGGTRTGTFDTVNNLPAGYSLDYGSGSNSQITLVVPEPSTLSLLALTATGLLGRRTRRRGQLTPR